MRLCTSRHHKLQIKAKFDKLFWRTWRSVDCVCGSCEIGGILPNRWSSIFLWISTGKSTNFVPILMKFAIRYGWKRERKWRWHNNTHLIKGGARLTSRRRHNHRRDVSRRHNHRRHEYREPPGNYHITQGKTQRGNDLIPALKPLRQTSRLEIAQSPWFVPNIFFSSLWDYYINLCYWSIHDLEWQTAAARLCRIMVSLVKGGSLHVGQ